MARTSKQAGAPLGHGPPQVCSDDLTTNSAMHAGATTQEVSLLVVKLIVRSTSVGRNLVEQLASSVVRHFATM